MKADFAQLTVSEDVLKGTDLFVTADGRLKPVLQPQIKIGIPYEVEPQRAKYIARRDLKAGELLTVLDGDGSDDLCLIKIVSYGEIRFYTVYTFVDDNVIGQMEWPMNQPNNIRARWIDKEPEPIKFTVINEAPPAERFVTERNYIRVPTPEYSIPNYEDYMEENFSRVRAPDCDCVNCTARREGISDEQAASLLMRALGSQIKTTLDESARKLFADKIGLAIKTALTDEGRRLFGFAEKENKEDGEA